MNGNPATTTAYYNAQISIYKKYLEPPRRLGKKLRKSQVQNNGITIDNDEKQCKCHKDCIRRRETAKVF